MTHRLNLYILMQNKSYLSMSMMIGILEDLAFSAQITWKEVATEYERLSGLIDIESSELYLYAVIPDK